MLRYALACLSKGQVPITDAAPVGAPELYGTRWFNSFFKVSFKTACVKDKYSSCLDKVTLRHTLGHTLSHTESH